MSKRRYPIAAEPFSSHNLFGFYIASPTQRAAVAVDNDMRAVGFASDEQRPYFAGPKQDRAGHAPGIDRLRLKFPRPQYRIAYGQPDEAGLEFIEE